MYIRMGSKDSGVEDKRSCEDHLHLDSIALFTRESADNYIDRLMMMRDALWPIEEEEETP